MSARWVQPVPVAGKTTQETWEYYADNGFICLTVLQENVEGGEPTLGEVNMWVESFDIEQPVLADGDKRDR